MRNYRTTSYRRLLIAVACVATLALSACSGGSGSTDGESTLVVAQASDAESLSPLEVTGVETANINIHIYDGLVRTGSDMTLQPALATKWEIVDPNTWRFELRQGVTFHDGSPFTAEDVKFTIDYILDPANKSGLRSYIAPITEVEIVNDYEILIHTKDPYVTLPKQLARAVLVVPKKTFETAGRDAFAQAPVGTGPYRFVSWSKDQQVVLEANDDYWGGRPKIDKLTIRTIPDAATRVAALNSGEVDIITAVAPDAAAQIEAASGVSVVSGTGLTQNFLSLNTFAPPFNDKRVRLAVNYAIDRETILKALLGGRGEVNNGPFAPDTFGYDKDLPGFDYDPDQARSLLADVGYANGLDVELMYEAGSGVSGANDQVAAAIADQLGDVGIRVTLAPKERAQYLQELLTDKTMKNMAIADNRDALGDADFILGLWYDSTRRAPYYNTPQLDALIGQELTILDENERLAKLQEIGRQIEEDAGVGLLFTVDVLYGVSDRVQGWQARGDRVLYVGPGVSVSS